MKVILNKCFGGFRPSVFAYNEHARRNAKALFWYTLNVHDYEFTENPRDFDTPSTIYYGKKVGFYDMDYENVYNLDKGHREDPVLIDIVEKYGEKASSFVSDLVVVEIPDELAGRYTIDDYDGVETLHEKVKAW